MNIRKWGIPLGKMTQEDLEDLLRCIETSPDVLVPPLRGFDCGVHKLGRDRCVVISTDPCVNVPIEHFGWLLFHYSASDVSVFGASPHYCTVELLGPPNTRPAVFKNVMKQFCKSANDLGTVIITGHTATYNGLNTFLGVCTAYGIIRRRDLVTPAGARPGDLILCTKPIGLEVLTNLALGKKRLAARLFGDRTRYLAKQVHMQSCFEEARLLAKSRQVSAMHDATEGGLVACLNEIADASNIGFVLDYPSLQILPELNILSKHFNLSRDQILSISSTGTILAAISPKHERQVLERLHRRGVDSRIVGVFTKSKKRLLKHDDQEKEFPKRFNDPYAEIIDTEHD
jgi:hydrogenase expression/formation protein HypE